MSIRFKLVGDLGKALSWTDRCPGGETVVIRGHIPDHPVTLPAKPKLKARVEDLVSDAGPSVLQNQLSGARDALGWNDRELLAQASGIVFPISMDL